MDYQEVIVLEHEMKIPKHVESFQQVCDQLEYLSIVLRDLLPDPSIGPAERLERLARIVPSSVLISKNHRTARSKLNELRQRLDELVPLPMNYEEKLEHLVEKIQKIAPNERRLFKILEKIGDQRVSDTGR